MYCASYCYSLVAAVSPSKVARRHRRTMPRLLTKSEHLEWVIERGKRKMAEIAKMTQQMKAETKEIEGGSMEKCGVKPVVCQKRQRDEVHVVESSSGEEWPCVNNDSCQGSLSTQSNRADGEYEGAGDVIVACSSMNFCVWAK